MTEKEEDFATMLAEFEKDAPKRRDPKVGETIKARIVSIGQEAIFLDVGAKSEGVLDIGEVRDPEGRITVAVGDTIEARVVESGGAAGVVLRRTALGRGPQAQAELQQAFELRLPVEGVVTGVNKGGVEVTVAGSRGFCPISQLELRHVEDASAYVGERLQFLITKYDNYGRPGPAKPGREDAPSAHRSGRREANLVLSRRAILEEEAHKRAAEVRARLSVGAVLRGTVTTIKDYGAFVDLGGLEGMLHVSELGFQRVSHPKDVLTVGQTVDVQVIRIEKGDDARRPEQLKISLSLKALAADPWDGLSIVEGMKVTGKVGRVESFGAFIEVAPGVEGLLSLRHLAGGRKVGHARQLIKPGAEVEVTVEEVDREKRRIALALAAAQADDDDQPPPPPAEKQKFGTFADLLGAAARKEKDKGKGKK